MGQHIATHLMNTGKHVVTAITRPGSTNKLPEGLKVAIVDYSSDDDTDLVKALEGQQALIITMSHHAPRDTTLKLIRAAAKAGVDFILPNWYGHDSRNKKLCDESMLTQTLDNITSEIERLGVSSYLLLVCGFWYSWSLAGGEDRFGFDFKKRSMVFFDDGTTPINTSTFPQCGKAIANVLSLKVQPDDESDTSPTLSQFRNKPIYISSFRASQRDMFESVKRVTGTVDDDWKITHESSEDRWERGTERVHKGDLVGFIEMMYSRCFFKDGGGEFESTRGLHNELLGLPTEDLDEWTAVGVRMATGNEYDYEKGARLTEAPFEMKK